MFKMFIAVSLLSMFNNGFGFRWMSGNYGCQACGYGTTFISAPYAYPAYTNYGYGNLVSDLGSHMADLTFELPGLIAQKTWLTVGSYTNKNFSYEDQMRLNQIDARIGEMENDSARLRSYGSSFAGIRY